MARIVFDALAKAHLIEHFQIKKRALLQALRLHELVVPIKLLKALFKFCLDAFDGTHHLIARRHVVACRIHHKARHLLAHLARERIKEHHRFDFVVEKLHAHRDLGVFCRKDVDRIAAHAKRTAQKLHVVALVLHLHELTDQVLAFLNVARAQNQAHLRVAFGLADAVDRRDRRHDHGVAPLKNRFGGRQTHLLDVFVYGRILLDEKIARGHIGFRLVVVVVGNEVLDGVVREKLAHFAVELRRKCLVGRHHDGWHADARDDVGHRKGLARARHAQQRLCAVPLLQPLGECGNRRRLVACRREFGMQFKGGMRKSQNLRHARAHRDG